jgi:DNA-binding NtrC family response regulator
MRVEVRFVCATNRELHKEIEAGTFRQDLFYRINVLTMHLPSLRERQEDIPMLVDYFLFTYQKKYEITARRPSSGVLESLQRYHWPGNIRELENVIKRYVILGSESEITHAIGDNGRECLIPELQADGVTSLKQVVRQAVKQVEKRVILEVLDANRWNRKKTARALRISYSALLYKMREAGVPPTRGRSAQLMAGKDPRTWPDFKPPKECEA